MPRYSYRNMPPDWRDCEQWREADLTNADGAVVERFHRMARGLRLYLGTGKLRAAATEAGCTSSVLLDVLNRCLLVGEDLTPIGWIGAVEGVRLTPYTRKKPTEGGDARGKSGSFTQFLVDNPQHRELLDELIETGGVHDGPRSSKPTRRGVASRFRTKCFARGMTENDYPFNTKDRGRRSIERYVARRIAEDAKTTSTWLGADAAKKRRLGTGKHSFPLAVAPFDVICMDTHVCHCTGTVIVDGPAGPQEVAIERILVHAMLDTNKHCVLSYSVSIASQISALSIEDALIGLSTPWRPKQLTLKGVEYLPGAALPVGNIPGLDEIRPCVIRCDNALQHFAHRLVEVGRRRLGCFVNFSPIGAWWYNPLIERFFRSLESYGIQQLPSSTGSNPADPLKPDSIAAALKYHITAEQIIELLDVIIASANATPSKSLGGQTPLQCLAAHLKSQTASLVTRPGAPPTCLSPKLGIVVQNGVVRGKLAKGDLRRPYVQVDGERYTSENLAGRFDLLDNPVVLHINERDMRRISAFEASGKPLGELYVSNKCWGGTAHTRQMRKVIQRHIRVGDYQMVGDIVLNHMESLKRNALKQIQERPRRVSRAATALLASSLDTGVPINEISNGEPDDPLRILERPIPSHLPKPKWGNK